MTGLKRFLAFAYYDYYPAGGWNDFVGDFDSVDEAKTTPRVKDVLSVVDTQSGETVEFRGSENEPWRGKPG